jgi:lipid-binding SYLF domain-containing protein
MKVNKFLKGAIVLLATTFIFSSMLRAQDTKADKIMADVKKAKTEFIKADRQMDLLFKGAYGYVIFPKISKGAAGVGGASGLGVVYEKGEMVGSSRMVQVTVGLQLGAEVYREVIFFEDKAALDRFKENKLEFTAQASAIAVKTGAAKNMKYTGGVAVFTKGRAGLMYDMSVGGQKFNYIPY